VNDEDLDLFESFSSRQRLVLPVSNFIPRWLHAFPFGLRFRNRNMWWSTLTLPVSGWHVQQIVKLTAATRLGHVVVVNIDSDVMFLKEFNVSSWLGDGSLVPLFRRVGGIDHTTPLHLRWLETAVHVLHVDLPPLPATDYISNIVAWRRETVTSLLQRVDRNTKMPWELALCRKRTFSEYLLYGYHTTTDPSASKLHRWIERSPCLTYWGESKLCRAALTSLIAGLAHDQTAIAVQSFGRTSIGDIRSVLDDA
jgi:hypothetical protein